MKKVKFAKFSTNQVCNVKKRPLQCFMSKKVTNLFQIGLFPHKKVKFAKFRTNQVCNVKKKLFQCLMLKKVTNLFQIGLFPHKKSQICQIQHERGL